MKNRMSFYTFNIIILIVFSCFTIGNSYGQENNTRDSTKTTSLKKGKFALQFQITENFRLSDFQGALISAKYHFSPESAVRFGVGLGADFTETDQLQKFVSNGDDSDDPFFWKRELMINTVFQFIYYLNAIKNPCFFIAIGPKFDYTRSKEMRGEKPLKERSPNIRTSYKAYGLGFGAVLNLGTELFIRKNVSLQAEYGVRYMYEYKKHTTLQPSKNSYTYEKHTFHPSKVKFGISLYL